MTCCRARSRTPHLVTAADFGKQAQYLQIKPNQGDHQAEGGVPLHVLRRASAGAALDEVEVQNQIQGGHNDYDDTDADAQWTCSID